MILHFGFLILLVCRKDSILFHVYIELKFSLQLNQNKKLRMFINLSFLSHIELHSFLAQVALKATFYRLLEETESLCVSFFNPTNFAYCNKCAYLFSEKTEAIVMKVGRQN